MQTLPLWAVLSAENTFFHNINAEAEPYDGNNKIFTSHMIVFIDLVVFQSMHYTQLYAHYAIWLELPGSRILHRFQIAVLPYPSICGIVQLGWYGRLLTHNS